MNVRQKKKQKNRREDGELSSGIQMMYGKHILLEQTQEGRQEDEAHIIKTNKGIPTDVVDIPHAYKYNRNRPPVLPDEA